MCFRLYFGGMSPNRHVPTLAPPLPQTFLAVSNPSTASRLTCVGQISNAGVNVRPSETAVCTIAILDASGQATYGQPADYRQPIVVGGTSLSAVTQGTAFSLTFTVVAPASYGATFTVLGQVQNGSSLEQGVLSLAVGEFGWEERQIGRALRIGLCGHEFSLSVCFEQM